MNGDIYANSGNYAITQTGVNCKNLTANSATITNLSSPQISTSQINGSNWYIDGYELNIPQISSTTINGPLNVNGNINTKAAGNSSYNLYTGTVYTNKGSY